MGIPQARDIGNGYATIQENISAAATEADSAHTVPAANLVGGQGVTVPTLARSFTLDTAANIDTASGAKIGDSFTYMLVNNSAGAVAITWVTNTGLTLKPTTPPTVPQNKIGFLKFVKTGAAAYDVFVYTSA